MEEQLECHGEIADGFPPRSSPKKILKELRELWVELGQGQSGVNHEAGGGVLRACAMTLLVAAEPDADGQDAEAAHRTIPAC